MLLPWFIYLLINLGLLNNPNSWHTLTPAEQYQLELIIIEDDINS